MKVVWRKTFHQWGEAEIPDGITDEKELRQFCTIKAAQQSQDVETVGWVWTDFYQSAAQEDLNAGLTPDFKRDGVGYTEWFDI